MEIGGHYTYYEKNPCMQNYMIASRKKKMGRFRQNLWKIRLHKAFVLWYVNGAVRKEKEGQAV